MLKILICLLIYLKCGLKYIAGLIFFSMILAFIYPIISLIVFIIGLIALPSVTKGKFEEEYGNFQRKQEERRIQSIAEKSKDEFEGFEQAMILTRRAMR